MFFLEENTWNMPGMRTIDCLTSALSKVATAPSLRAGYEEMLRCYLEAGMAEEADSISFLISEKFRANSTDTDSKQQ
jgi:hypothetical protein